MSRLDWATNQGTEENLAPRDTIVINMRTSAHHVYRRRVEVYRLLDGVNCMSCLFLPLNPCRLDLNSLPLNVSFGCPAFITNLTCNCPLLKGCCRKRFSHCTASVKYGSPRPMTGLPAVRGVVVYLQQNRTNACCVLKNPF